jgi:pimeloyl-ACP methyl ester carboxylesterase
VTIAVIPEASHALIPEQPAAVADAIVRWIGTLPRRP